MITSIGLVVIGVLQIESGGWLSLFILQRS